VASLQLEWKLVIKTLVGFSHCARLTLDKDVPEFCKPVEVNTLPLLMRGIRLVAFPEPEIVNMHPECRILHVCVNREDVVKDTLSELKISV
jgi:hypothetical protein